MTNLRKSLASKVFLVLVASRASLTAGFVPFCPSTQSPPTRTAAPIASNAGVGVGVGVGGVALSMIRGGEGTNEQGEVGKGDNWLEKSFRVDPDETISPRSIDDYNLGVCGKDFQTGSLSKRMYDTIVSGSAMGGSMSSSSSMSDEIQQAFMLYAMDFTAKEATRAALRQNGLEMVLQEEDEDQGMWGDVEAVRLYDDDDDIDTSGSETPGSSSSSSSELYDSLEEAIADWTPGQTFDFVVRQVPAKLKELSIDELVQALDPEGKLREEAKERGGDDAGEPDEEALLSIIDDGMTSIGDLANDNVRRVEEAPRGSTDATNAYKGGDSRGYRVIHRSDISRDSINADGTENEKTVLHVMNALVAHGVLLIDLTDGGTSFEDAEIMARMWETADKFFETTSDSSVAAGLPGMTTVMETGSQHAMVGYSEYDAGSMKFLETRRERTTGKILPEQAEEFLGEHGTAAMESSFDLIAQAGKDVVRIAVAASSVENGAFFDPDSHYDDDDEAAAERDQMILASKGATLLANELVDDGKPLPSSGLEIDHSEGRVSMSPYRLCRYTDAREETGSSREVFGAHTDSSFVTAVPVAEISGLEVYDEDAGKWYRPELRARAHWEEEQRSLGKDPSLRYDETTNGKQIPWHARYLAIMPGENLQLATRNEIPAAIHRVVAVKGEQARVSAPVLLRGRPGTKFLAERYIGGWLGNQLILDADGLSMEEIHEKNQPQSFQ